MIFFQTSNPPQASPLANDNAEEYAQEEGWCIYSFRLFLQILIWLVQ